MQNKIIGVSPRINRTETNTFIRVNRNYIDKLTEQGLIPFIITPGSDLSAILPLCAGFLVIGGDDFNPEVYGETNEQGLSKEIDDEMDALDKEIINYAVEHKLPVMGICRGHQALSAIFGKSLYQDFESAGLSHPHEGIYHEVTKVTDFGLAKLLPEKFTTNTYHHQSIKDLADGFVVLFKNHDVVEGVEHTTLPIFGLQWHPERMDTKESEIIFTYFKDKVLKNE